MTTYTAIRSMVRFTVMLVVTGACIASALGAVLVVMSVAQAVAR